MVEKKLTGMGREIKARQRRGSEFVESLRKVSYKIPVMAEFANSKDSANKMMLGFIVRRCAADLGHTPTPEEFARWANYQKQNGKTYCLFGKEISASVAKVMFSQPGRMVTVSPEGLDRLWKFSGR